MCRAAERQLQTTTKTHRQLMNTAVNFGTSPREAPRLYDFLTIWVHVNVGLHRALKAYVT